MKKLLALFMVMILCVSLCACGDKQDNFLTKTSWVNIYDENETFTFKSNGTGTFENQDTTWSFENNSLTVSYMGSMQTMTLKFDIVEYENSTMIIECPNDIVDTMILVPLDNYEETAEKVKNYMTETATPLDCDTLYNEILENEARAMEKYTGTVVKWTAKVYYIHDDFCQMAIDSSGGIPVNSIDVYMGTKELVKFNKFDEITVVGILEVESMSAVINAAFVVE